MKLSLAAVCSFVALLVLSCASPQTVTEPGVRSPEQGEEGRVEKPAYAPILEEQGLTAEFPYVPPRVDPSASFTVGSTDRDFRSLAEALASDRVAEGSMLLLTETEYSERELVVSKSVVIKAATHGHTVIKAREEGEKARGRLFTVMPEAHLTLIDVHLKNGAPIDSLRTGGAICNYGALTVLGCAFSANTANCGGAIHSEGGTLTAVGCRFTGNCADGRNKDDRDCGSGGAVKTQDSGTAILIDCVLTENRARYKGGAVKTSCLSRTVVIDCSITNNGCVATGGGIDSGGPLYVERSTITGNEARGRLRHSRYAGMNAGSGIYSKGDLFLYHSLITGEESHYDVVVEPGSNLVSIDTVIGHSAHGNEPGPQ